MKKKIIVILMALMLGFGGVFVVTAGDEKLVKRELVICPCGCSLTAMKCGCPAAMEALKEFDKKYKGA